MRVLNSGMWRADEKPVFGFPGPWPWLIVAAVCIVWLEDRDASFFALMVAIIEGTGREIIREIWRAKRAD